MNTLNQVTEGASQNSIWRRRLRRKLGPGGARRADVPASTGVAGLRRQQPNVRRINAEFQLPVANGGRSLLMLVEHA